MGYCTDLWEAQTLDIDKGALKIYVPFEFIATAYEIC